jgi:hypothetical protein
MSRDKKRKVSPSSEVLDIAALEPKIQETLEMIRVDIEAFLQNPELPEWVPPSFTNPSVSEFLRILRIPAYQNGSPSLLFHNLHFHDNEVLTKLFGRGKHMYLVTLLSL